MTPPPAGTSRRSLLTAAAIATAAPLVAGSPARAADTARTRSWDLTVLGTSDTHGNVYNWDYYRDAEYDDSRHNDVGVAKLATLVNQIRGFVLERGIAVARGRRTLEKALPGLLEDHAQELGTMLCGLIECLRAQWRAVDQPITALDEQILALARQDATSQRLMAIPGVGPMLATALVAAIGSGA